MSDQFYMTRYDMQITWADEDLLNADALAREAGLNLRMIQRLYNLGVIDASAEREGEPLFTYSTVRRLRRVLRLRRDLGLAWNSLGLVADLLERIETLEMRLRQIDKQDLNIET